MHNGLQVVHGFESSCARTCARMARRVPRLDTKPISERVLALLQLCSSIHLRLCGPVLIGKSRRCCVR